MEGRFLFGCFVGWQAWAKAALLRVFSCCACGWCQDEFEAMKK